MRNRHVFCIVLPLIFSTTIAAQTFEVASIRPNGLGYIDIGGNARLLNGQTRCRGTDTQDIPGDPLPPTPLGRCRIGNSTLKEMINVAYALRFGPARPVVNQRIVGGPEWAESAAFDI